MHNIGYCSLMKRGDSNGYKKIYNNKKDQGDRSHHQRLSAFNIPSLSIHREGTKKHTKKKKRKREDYCSSSPLHSTHPSTHTSHFPRRQNLHRHIPPSTHLLHSLSEPPLPSPENTNPSSQPLIRLPLSPTVHHYHLPKTLCRDNVGSNNSLFPQRTPLFHSIFQRKPLPPPHLTVSTSP